MLTRESQNELIAALAQQQYACQHAAEDVATNIKRELTIADAYVFHKAFNAAQAAAFLGLVSSQGILGKPLQSAIYNPGLQPWRT